jgi:hypothetical protein
MHGQIPNDIPGVRASLFHAAAFECDFRKLLDVKKILSAQMLVPFRNGGINARRLNRGRDGRFFRMLAIDLDCPAELREPAFRISKKVPDP